MSALFVVVLVAISLLVVTAIISFNVYKKALEIMPYKEALDSLKNSIFAANNKIKELSFEIQQMIKEKNEVQRIIDQRDAAQKFLDEHDSELIKKHQESDEINKQIEELKNTLKDVEDDLESQNMERKKLLDSIHEAEQIKNTLSLSLENLKKEIQDNKEIQKSLSAEIRDLEIKVAGLSQSVESLAVQKSNLEAEIEKLEVRINDLRQQEKDLHNRIEEGEAKYTEAIASREQTIRDLDTQIAKLQKETVPLEVQKLIDEDMWKDLDRAVVDISERNVRKIKTEINWLDDFKNNLQSSGFIFSDRTINAFHTSLKIEDKSPLVVLAGISGTGKSLLPQMYAEAMGMNFVSVAVQPRWDSPQDMLGFYNYMQNKYKATELSRLLWQFDIYNNPITRKNFSSADNLPMNLVLLDEMNLARVEYYFSDMLSKLEIRRTVDPEKDSSRVKSEIEIECSSLISNKSSRRLFINSNTLFVGTMNEDETTQSLSDKVIDRSNMLRFGKPEKLQANPDNKKFSSNYDPESYSTLFEWKSFLPQEDILSSIQASFLKDTIDNLNDALSSVNRPFAYRVWQSIYSYINSYPSANSTQQFYNALSDQIEMKVLPKLNGLEKSNSDVQMAFDKIEMNIAKLKDDELLEEFEKARKDSDSELFFKWKGVARSK